MKIPLLESPANISCTSLHNFLSCSKSGLGIFFPFPRDRKGSGSCERKEHSSQSAGPSVSPSAEVSHACSVISQHLEILPQSLVSTCRVSMINKAVLICLSSTSNSFLCKVYMMPKECFVLYCFHQISSNLQHKFYFATHLSGREYPFLCSGRRHL